MFSQGFPFSNPDLTPAAFLWASRGLVTVPRWKNTYDDWIFDGKDISFGEIPKYRKKTDLLIHATDVKNRLPFTFDEYTFKCLGVSAKDFNKLSISLAAAASSALPILFEPLNLEEVIGEVRRPDSIPPKCPKVYLDKLKKRLPELLDGGIHENLGLAGLIRTIFREKKVQVFEKKEEPNTKNFIIIVNSAAPAVKPFPSLGEDSSTMINNIDQSIDTLQRDKTSLARSIYKEPLNNFGFKSMEINFADIKEDPHLIRRIRSILKDNGISKEQLERTLEFADSFTELEDRVKQDLNKITMKPDKEEIDTLIAVGRTVVHAKIDNLRKILVNLPKRKFKDDCKKILNPTKFYCWPDEFKHSPDILERPLSIILADFSESSRNFNRETTKNRIQVLREKQKAGLENRKNLEKMYLAFRANYDVETLDKKYRQFYELWGLQKKADNIRIFAQIKKHISIKVGKILVDPKSQSNSIRKDAWMKMNEEVVAAHILPAVAYLRGNVSSVDAHKDLDSCANSHSQRCKMIVEVLGAMKNLQNCSYEFDRNCSEFLPKKVFQAWVSKCSQLNNFKCQTLYRKNLEEVLSNPRYFALLGYLNYSLDRYSQAFFHIFAGIDAFPDDFNLRAQLALYSFLEEENHFAFKKHMQKGINELEAIRLKLGNLKNNIYDLKKLEIFLEVEERFKKGVPLFKMQSADYWALAPKEHLYEPFKKNDERSPDIFNLGNVEQEGQQDNWGLVYGKEIKDLLGDKFEKSKIEPTEYGIHVYDMLYPYALEMIKDSAQSVCPMRAETISKAKKLLEGAKGNLLLVAKDQVKNLLGKFKYLAKGKKELVDEVEKFTTEINDSRNEWKFGDFMHGVFDKFFPFKLDESDKRRFFWKNLASYQGDDNSKGIDYQEELSDLMVYMFDLKYINLFLDYADELECLNGA